MILRLHHKREFRSFGSIHESIINTFFLNNTIALPYRPKFLSVLKDQILEHEVNKKKDFWVRSQESDFYIAIDRNTLEEERQSLIKKRVYLQQFRDANKEVSGKECKTR